MNSIYRKSFNHVFFLVVLGLFLSACQTSEPETIIKTVIVEKEGKPVVETVVVTVEPTEQVEETPEVKEVCCDAFRIGIYEEPVSLNYWNYLGPGSSVWSRYVLSNDAAHLFALSEWDFQFVPSLALDIPLPVENEDGSWDITVEMIPETLWSDGEPITTADVVFTHNVCKDFDLAWYWPTFCKPDGAEITAEALDEYTVRYTYLDQVPNLRNWQFGLAQAPILPAHYWEPVVAAAIEQVEAVGLPTAERPHDCDQTGLAEALTFLCDAWTEYDDALSQAREILFSSETTDQPIAGGYIVQEWEPGEFIQLGVNDFYYFKDSEIVAYEDGTWQRVLPDGTKVMFYGNAQGDETLRYAEGPFNPEIIYEIYGSQEAAFGALITGEVDYVLNPIGVTREIRDQIQGLEGIQTYINADYNMFYLAFNLLKYPMSLYEFRQVFDIILDKELVIHDVLGDAVLPLYSTMPAANAYWHNQDVPEEYMDITRAERVDLAVTVLKDAGWRWASEPYWDEFVQDVVPGEGLRMPNGELMPELTILGPGPEFDIVRATFNQWVSEWARELGMPVNSELTGRNAILDSVFVASDYDMYIFGWPLGNPAYPDYYEEFWYGGNCTFETGGMNTTCFKNNEYDALVDEFISIGDLQRARELVYEMQLILADQRPFIPLYSEKIFDFARSNVKFPFVDTLGGIELQDGFRNSTQVLIME